MPVNKPPDSHRYTRGGPPGPGLWRRAWTWLRKSQLEISEEGIDLNAPTPPRPPAPRPEEAPWKTERPFIQSEKVLELVHELGIAPRTCQRVVIDMAVGKMVRVTGYLAGNTGVEEVVKALGDVEFEAVEKLRGSICFGERHVLGCTHNETYFRHVRRQVDACLGCRGGSMHHTCGREPDAEASPAVLPNGPRITLDAEAFERLVQGKEWTAEGVDILLEDIGFDEMLRSIFEARDGLGIESGSVQFLTMETTSERREHIVRVSYRRARDTITTETTEKGHEEGHNA